LHQVVRHAIADCHRNGNRHAAFARGAVRCADERLHRRIRVCIFHDHEMVLRTAQRLHAFAVPVCCFEDVARDRRRSNETDRRDAVVLQERVYRCRVAVDDVEDARRQPGVVQ